MEGIVQISITDFDRLREDSKQFNSLKQALHGCADFEIKETAKDSDEWYQIIKIDGSKVATIAAQYADVEDIYDNDVIKLVNVKEIVVKK